MIFTEGRKINRVVTLRSLLLSTTVITPFVFACRLFSRSYKLQCLNLLDWHLQIYLTVSYDTIHHTLKEKKESYTHTQRSLKNLCCPRVIDIHDGKNDNAIFKKSINLVFLPVHSLPDWRSHQHCDPSRDLQGNQSNTISPGPPFIL